MRVLFDYHELWDVVESGVSALGDNVTEAQRVAHRDQKKKDNKALYLIHQGMNDETFEQIEGATNASEAWIIFSTNYKGDDKIKRVHLQTLRRQYELLQMETTETIDVYINKVIALTNQMKTNGETHSEQAKMEKNFRSLTPRFEHVVAAIEEANEISKMTVSYYANECISKDDNHAANCTQEESNHEQDEDDHVVLMAATSNETPNNQTWYLDTGCTNHMCGKKELFADLYDSFRTKVKFGDGRFVPMTGKGRILITLKNGDHRYIYDVFYVPDMKSNLLSMGQLAEKGYSLENLSKRNLVNALPHIHHPDQLCEACIFGKNHRIPFVKEPWRAKFPLELVHIDVCGPMNISSVGESEPVRLVDVIQHPKWQKDMNEELMAIEKNNIITQIGKVVPNQN
ncbi:uncharacterized protein [Phaseolus vulgaris]|uniref:uncharacterized protein n=1 Tax=Phaseolus vulgaris TaxID=3885 RepID=UPI0035CACD0E